MEKDFQHIFNCINIYPTIQSFPVTPWLVNKTLIIRSGIFNDLQFSYLAIVDMLAILKKTIELACLVRKL